MYILVALTEFRYPGLWETWRIERTSLKKEFSKAYVSYNDTGRLCTPSDATNHGMTGRLNLFKLPRFCELCSLSHTWSIMTGKEWINQMHLGYKQAFTVVIFLGFCWVELLLGGRIERSKCISFLCPNYVMIWYICRLQLDSHPVAVVQCAFTHKQYIEVLN